MTPQRLFGKSDPSLCISNYLRLIELSTCILCLGSFGVMNMNLQVKELHYLFFKGCTGPHVHPDVDYGGQELLSKMAHLHATVQSSSS